MLLSQLSRTQLLASGGRGSSRPALPKGSAVAGRPQTVHAARAEGRGGNIKTQAANASYVCVDCGYIYTDKKTPFEKLPASYRCPACAAGKNRFKPFQTSDKSNNSKSMEKRVAALRKELADNGEEVGEDLSFLIATGASAAVILGAAYYFTVLAK